MASFLESILEIRIQNFHKFECSSWTNLLNHYAKLYWSQHRFPVIISFISIDHIRPNPILPHIFSQMICIFKDHFNRPILSKPSNSKIQPVLRGVIEIYISIPFDFDREWTRIDDSCACDVASGEATINDNSWGQLNICSIRMPCGCLSILRSAFWYVIIIHL